MACPFSADYPGAARRPAAVLQDVDRQCRARAGAENPRRTRRPSIHAGALSRVSRQQSDRAGLRSGRIRADQRADDRHHTERHGRGEEPAEQAISAHHPELRLPTFFRACYRDPNRIDPNRIPGAADWQLEVQFQSGCSAIVAVDRATTQSEKYIASTNAAAERVGISVAEQAKPTAQLLAAAQRDGTTVKRRCGPRRKDRRGRVSITSIRENTRCQILIQLRTLRVECGRAGNSPRGKCLQSSHARPLHGWQSTFAHPTKSGWGTACVFVSE